MKTFAASTFVVSLLFVASSCVRVQSEASTDSPSQIVQPTPSKRTNPEKVKPTPICSPTSTPLLETLKNDPDYREPSPEELGINDSDCDGICNRNDNCVLVFNPDQKDSDKDGFGDACDPKLVDKSFTDLRCDADGDGIPDNKDNCPWICNPDQKFTDVNKNGVNDLCDNALPNSITGQKPCPKRIKVKAPTPQKSSSDKQIDPCEGDPGCDAWYEHFFRSDNDGDGILNREDNCFQVCNPDQKDVNKNGIGDACDAAFGNSPYISKPCRKPKKLKP